MGQSIGLSRLRLVSTHAYSAARCLVPQPSTPSPPIPPPPPSLVIIAAKVQPPPSLPSPPHRVSTGRAQAQPPQLLQGGQVADAGVHSQVGGPTAHDAAEAQSAQGGEGGGDAAQLNLQHLCVGGGEGGGREGIKREGCLSAEEWWQALARELGKGSLAMKTGFGLPPASMASHRSVQQADISHTITLIHPTPSVGCLHIHTNVHTSAVMLSPRWNVMSITCRLGHRGASGCSTRRPISRERLRGGMKGGRQGLGFRFGQSGAGGYSARRPISRERLRGEMKGGGSGWGRAGPAATVPGDPAAGSI